MSAPCSTRLLSRRFASQTPIRAVQTHAQIRSRSLHPLSPRKVTFPPQRPFLSLLQHRTFSVSSRIRNETAVSAPTSEETQSPAAEAPAYEMSFTCKKCETRSTHRISKQGYHKGTVLVTCPGCKNRHLIADHLKIFSDKSITIEDILKEKGQLVKRGTLGMEGDVEFWDDGTQTGRQPSKSGDNAKAKI